MPVDLVVLSLPVHAAPGSLGAPETRLYEWIKENVGVKHGVASVALPDLKIGTLDNLVVQSEEVARLDAQLQSLVGKTHEVIASLCEGDASAIAHAELVDGRSAWLYLQQFGWNTARYRPDRPISQLLEAIAQDGVGAEADLRQRYQAFTAAKQALATAERKQTGDLSVRSLVGLVRRTDVVLDSEFLESVLLVLSTSSVPDFLATYESISPMVVPRSAHEIKREGEQSLFSVTVFRKFSAEFRSKAREHKWSVRELDFAPPPASDDSSHNNGTTNNNGSSGSGASSAPLTPEAERHAAQTAERKLRSEVGRLASASYADIIKAWGHTKLVRLFVESVLRYGLPANFITASFIPDKSAESALKVLTDRFAYLAGNAVATDRRGRVKDDKDLTEFGAFIEHDYRPFVVYDMQLP